MKKTLSTLIIMIAFTANALAAPALSVDFVSEKVVEVSVKPSTEETQKIASWYFKDGILYITCVNNGVGNSGISTQRIVSPEPIFPAPVILTNSLDKFPDITKYRNEILTLNSRGIISGYPDGTFAGDRVVKRAEISVMLFKAGRYKSVGEPSAFSDVSGHWSERYVASLNALGIINGYTDGTFKPEKRVKVAEVLTLINGMFEFYSDSDVAIPSVSEHWSKPHFENLVKKGIILPEDEIYRNYQPEREASRYEVALLLARALNKNAKIK